MTKDTLMNIGFRDLTIGCSTAVPTVHVEESFVAERPVRSVEVTVGLAKLQLLWLPTSRSITANRFTESEEWVPWFRVLGIELDELKELLMDAEEDVPPFEDLAGLRGWLERLLFDLFQEGPDLRRLLWRDGYVQPGQKLELL